MIYFLLLIAITFITNLFSVDFVQEGLITTIDGEPSGVIDGHVNAISGGFFDYDVDMVLPGPEPLHITRNWLQTVTHSKRSLGKTNMTEWYFGDRRGFYFDDADPKKYGSGNCTGGYTDTRGQQVHFFFSKPKKHEQADADTWDAKLKQGVTNTSSGMMQAQSDIRNHHCSWIVRGKNCWMRTPTGSTVSFERYSDVYYQFTEETKPNYLRIRRIEQKQAVFHRLDNHAGEILSQYYIHSHEGLKPFWMRFTAQDGRVLEYLPVKVKLDHHQEKSDKHEAVQVGSVIRPNAPRVDYKYYNGSVYKDSKNPMNSLIVWPKVAEKSLPDNRGFEITYYTKELTSSHDPRLCRVRDIKAPIGTGPERLLKYHFDYHLPQGEKGEGCTGVRNAKGILTNYSFDKNHRLSQIVKYDANLSPYTDETLHWGPRHTPRQIELWGRVFGPAGKPFKTFCKYYHYDGKGNVIREDLWGNLTGKHGPYFALNSSGLPAGGDTDCFIKYSTYGQDHLNLLIEAVEGEVTTRYDYIPNTNLVIAKYRSTKDGIFERKFTDYDRNGLPIAEVTDDGRVFSREDLAGVTFRKINRITRSYTYPVGLALVESEFYLDLQDGQEKLLIEKRNHYDGIGRLLCRQTFGSDGLFAYEERWEYDAHGNCLLHMDPAGRQVVCTYDANDNKITEQGPHPDLKKRMLYDYMNRLIKVEEQHPDVLLTQSISYDLLGNPIATVDTFGNETLTEYDDFNRPVKITAPSVFSATGEWIRPVTKYQFDEMGNITSVIDPEGNETQFSYTVYKKPCRIIHPDGSSESFEYDLQGRLVKEVARNGSVTHYTLDYLGRIIKKEIYSQDGVLQVQTSAVYSTFHLLSETDPQGFTTYYQYDAAGRKTAETKGEQVTYYTYDSLSRPTSTIKGDTVQTVIYDVLNRKIETRSELIDGTLQKSTKYEYDHFDNCVRVEEFTPAGPSVTESQYDSHNLLVLKIDPLGNRTTSKQDYHFRNPQGQRVYYVESVDPLGQKTVIIHDALGRVAVEQRFDPYGTLLQESSRFYNAAGKCTRVEMDAISNGERLRKVVNIFEYDTFGMLRRLVQAANTTDAKEFTTHYNLAGEKDAFTKPDGVTLHYQYDPLGRLVHYYSSDNSFAYRYTYNAMSQPILVEDLILNRITTRSYDIYGNMVHEELANSLAVEMEYDVQERLTHLVLPDKSHIQYAYEGIHLKQVERRNSKNASLYAHNYDEYDSAGRLKKSTLIKKAGAIHYQYNLNHSIGSISSPLYNQSLSYDALGNLVSSEINGEKREFTYDSLYQLESESGVFNHSYSFDSLHNRLEKDGKQHTVNCLNQLLDDGETTYTYDLSGNLIATDRNRFTYDALDRLVRLEKGKEVYTFSYDENNRCLFISENGTTHKILYFDQNDIGTYSSDNRCLHLRILGKGLGAEIGAAVAIEIQNKLYVPVHDHNGNLVRLLNENGSLCQKYDYTAFGEESVPKNALSPWRFASKRTVAGYLLFGRRLYDPKVGRWLSQDPTGYDAGPNLYAYLSNNPLTHFDSYGFFGLDSVFSFIDSGMQTAGSVMQEGFWHAGAHSGFRDIGMATGYLMQHKTLEGFQPSWMRERSEYYKMEGKPLYNGDTFLAYFNGMNTPLKDAIAARDNISETMGGVRVDLIYNADKGILSNTKDTLMDKNLFPSEPSRVAIRALRQLVDEAKGAMGNVSTISFSQGGEITYQAMKHLPVEDRSIVSNYTLGSAHFILDMQQKDFYNIASKGDPICAVSNHNYLPALNGKVEGVQFLPNMSNCFFDHAMDSPTYKEGLEIIRRRMESKRVNK